MGGDGGAAGRVVALGFFLAEGKKVHRVVQGFGEAIEAGRVGFELAEAVGAGEGNCGDQVKTLLGDGDEAGAAISWIGADDAEVEAAQVVDRLTEGSCMHVEAFAERSEGHVRAFGQNVKHGELQTGNAVALL